MAQFSVKEAAKFSLSAYRKHFVLLLSAAALVVGSYWFATVAPRFVAEKVGVQQVFDIDMVTIMQQPQGQETDQSKMVLQKVQEISAKFSTHFSTAPKHLLALVLLVFLFVWGLYFTLILGAMKLALNIKDKDSGSLALLLEVSPRQVMRFLGASLIFGLYFICAIMGIGIVTFSLVYLCKGFLGDGVTMLLTAILFIVLLVAMLCWFIRYVFYGYCIVDKPNLGACAALKMSREISRGSGRRIIAAALLLGIFAGIVMFITKKVMMMIGCACSLEQQMMIASFVGMVVTYPFSMPFFGYMYRSLSNTGR